jgi:hypothetical protein
MAAMSYALNFPFVQVAFDQLRIACDEVEGQIHLRSVKLSNEVQQAFSDAYALIIWQDHESGDAKIITFHPSMSHSDECYWFALIFGHVAADPGAEAAV